MPRFDNILLSEKDIRLVVTTDGRVFRPRREGGLVCVQQKEPFAPHQLLLLLQEGEALNSPGGKNFEAARQLLETYRRLALGSADPFDTGGPGGQASWAKQGSHAAADPEAVLARLNSALDDFLDSPSPAVAEAGDLLYARFVKPEYETKPTEFYMALFKCSRATWFRMVNQAISLFSSYLFGLLPGREAGTALF
ncbi:MAG: hypothetical protein HUJ80_06170 [Firmicutes bacterium]|nr:hypothetical protein [Bacillota bacterium]